MSGQTSLGAPDVLDFHAIARAMWKCAWSGITTDATGVIDTQYVRRCSRRVGATTLVFTRDDPGRRCRFWSPALQRAWHLSIACRAHFERDAWLRAFFGEQLRDLWASGPATMVGCAFEVWHWRLFCEADWSPSVLLDLEEIELRAAGLIAASEVALIPLAST